MAAARKVSRENESDSSAAAAPRGSKERPYEIESDAESEEYVTDDEDEETWDEDEDVDMAGDSEIDDYRELRRMPAAARAAEPIERQRNYVRMREAREGGGRRAATSRYIDDEAREVYRPIRAVLRRVEEVPDSEAARAMAGASAAQIAFNRKRFRNATGTIHAPFYNIEALKILLNTHEAVDAYRFQEEKCPDTGRLHLQYVIFFNKQLSGLQVKTILGMEAHIEAVQKPQNAWDYCGKPESRVSGPWEKGKPPGQGERSDLQMLAVEVVAGKRLGEIAREHPAKWIQYSKGILQLRQALQAQETCLRETTRTVHVRIGETGTGKTYGVLHDAEVANIPLWVKGETGKWLDTYDGQEWALIDELTPDAVPFPWMMRLLDNYDVTMEIKGGTVRWKPNVIWITSNFEPREWWSWKDIAAGNGKPGMTRESYKALCRRIATLTVFYWEYGPGAEARHVVQRKYEGEELTTWLWKDLGGA